MDADRQADGWMDGHRQYGRTDRQILVISVYLKFPSPIMWGLGGDSNKGLSLVVTFLYCGKFYSLILDQNGLIWRLCVDA